MATSCCNFRSRAPPHLAHAAAAKEAKNLVSAEAGARFERHVRLGGRLYGEAAREREHDRGVEEPMDCLFSSWHARSPQHPVTSWRCRRPRSDQDRARLRCQQLEPCPCAQGFTIEPPRPHRGTERAVFTDLSTAVEWSERPPSLVPIESGGGGHFNFSSSICSSRIPRARRRTALIVVLIDSTTPKRTR